jgi:hypothetical protein
MSPRADRRSFLLALAACAGLAAGAHAGGEPPRAELVMYERDGCPWCLRWHQDIGTGYPKSEEGQRAPLRVVRSSDPIAVGASLKAPLTMAPTFVLVSGGREVGRIVGYPGAEFFYGLLDELISRLDKQAASSPLAVSKI